MGAALLLSWVPRGEFGFPGNHLRKIAEAVRPEKGGNLFQPRRNVLACQAEDALAKLADPLIEGADDVDRERRAGLEKRAEVAALDAPHLALARGDGELLHQGAVRPQHFAEEIARLEDG